VSVGSTGERTLEERKGAGSERRGFIGRKKKETVEDGPGLGGGEKRGGMGEDG